MNSSQSHPSRWEKLGTEVQFTTRVFAVTSVKYRHGPRDRTRDFSVINAPDWVNVVAVTTDHQIVMVRQFRYGIDDFSVEIPGGVIEAGEDPVVAGARELEEETGFTGSSARLLGSVHPNPAIQSNRCHFVLVENARLTHPLAWDDDEELQAFTLPVEKVYELAQQGGIVHALVLNALLLFEPVWKKSQGAGNR